MKILKEAEYKSFDWANFPVIGENMFREYDLRNPMIPLKKGGKDITPAINVQGFFIMGQAYGSFVQEELKEKKIVVGSDYRSYSKGNAYAFITGVLSTGADVVDIGTVVTPVVYFAPYHLNLVGGATITASHNDNGWTGLKLHKGLSKTFGPDDIQQFKQRVYEAKFLKGAGNYEVYDGDIEEEYLKDIEKHVKSSVGNRKLKVVASGANGGGSFFITEILKRLGFEVIPFACDLDWDFPKFNPNPENVKFAEAIGEFVRENKADLGVAIDGDGDRFGVVDENGQIIFSDRAALFIMRFLVPKEDPGQKIVIDVKSTGASSRDPILKGKNTEIVFSKTGHYYVKDLANKIDALAGFERSGHFILKREFGRGYDDASVAAAWFTAILSNEEKPLSELIAEQPKSYQSPTMEPAVQNDVIKYEIVDKVVERFKEMFDKDEPFAGLKLKELVTINGVRFIFENESWGLIRASSNQPVLVTTAESFESKRQMYDIVEAIQKLLSEFPEVGEYDQTLPPYPGED
ncbi:phosphomannomutase/phosphoglucomutase [Nanoarchaeota archaeon]